MVYEGQNISTTVLGTDLNYPEVRNVNPQEGQYFTQEDLDSAKPVVVLGSKVRDDLFGVGGQRSGLIFAFKMDDIQLLG